MFGEKTWENVQGIFMLKLYPDFVVLFFIFTSFNTTRVILLVKIIKFEIASQLKVINSGALMLVCRWASVNDLVQNKFRSIIHLLSQHLLAQSHRQKHQMNVQDLLKVNNKDTRTKSLTLFCPSSLFSVSIVDFEQVKSWLGSKSHRSKIAWYSSFVVHKKHLIYCCQRWTQNL